MRQHSNNFFEKHVEKIVLVVVGLVCLGLLVTRVFISPNYIEYANRKFTSGKIDDYIRSQAEFLEDKLNANVEPIKPYEPNVGDFASMIDSSVRAIDISLYIPKPAHSSINVLDDREYRIPFIGEVFDVSAEHIRAAAYLPVERVDEDNIYDDVESEPNDIDLVTVECKFDVAGLYERFRESFVGHSIKEQWRDPCLASPVFAAVQLERQQRLDDGRWSEWEVVPRLQIDSRRKMFKIIEDVNELPAGGIKVRMLQFDERTVARDLLQPRAYMIASAYEEWFPPSLHKKYLKYRQEQETRRKREARNAEQEERDRLNEQAREKRRRLAEKARTTTTTTSRRTGLGGEGFGGEGGGSGGGSTVREIESSMAKRRKQSKTSERVEKPGKAESVKTIDDFYDDLNEILISETKNVKEVSELLFWAHDDSVEPGRSYRYRMRLGVFNPIAGTNWFKDSAKSLKNKVVLWSEYSDVSDSVKIPRLMYFFPQSLKQQASRIVDVRVSKYVLGYWYSKDFGVRPGEAIGYTAKTKNSATRNNETDLEQTEGFIPESIDYSTGVVLVDVAPVNDWTSGRNIHDRHYYKMLYSSDGKELLELAIGRSYWPQELYVKHIEIGRFEKEPKEPLRQWGKTTGQRRRVFQRDGQPKGIKGPEGIKGLSEQEMFDRVFGE